MLLTLISGSHVEDFLKLAKNLGIRGFESHHDVDKENVGSVNDDKPKKDISEKLGTEMGSGFDTSMLRDRKTDLG